MKIRIILAFVAACCACNAASEPSWTEITRRVKAYAAHPSTENARSAISAIPDKQISFSGVSAETEANQSIYAEKPMFVLEKQVQKRHQASVELAFRMMNIADGAFAEDLDVIVGKLITIDPALFLEELQKVNKSDLGGLVLNLDDTYVDEMKRTCAEWFLRKKALQGVEVPGLQNIKKRAIATINEGSSICSTQQIAPLDAPTPAVPGRR